MVYPASSPISTAGGGTAEALAQDHWTITPAAPIQGRTGNVAVWDGTSMIVWGGQTAAAPYSRGTALSDGASYNPHTLEWARLPTSPLSARPNATAIWTGRQVFIWGGNTSAGHWVATGALYDPITQTWKTISPSPLMASPYVTAEWTGKEVIVWDTQSRTGTCEVSIGCSAHTTLTAALYDPTTSQWHTLPSLPPGNGSTLSGLSGVVIDGRLYVVEVGVRGPHPTLTAELYPHDAELFMLDPAHTAWAHASLGTSSKYLLGNVVWVGSGLVFTGCLGGCDPSGEPVPPQELEVSTMYTVATHKWTSVALGPSTANSDPLLWTGNALVAVNAGAWDPVTNVWKTLPTDPYWTNVGVGVAAPSVVWTGSDIIAWGNLVTPLPNTSATLTQGLQFGP